MCPGCGRQQKSGYLPLIRQYNTSHGFAPYMPVHAPPTPSLLVPQDVPGLPAAGAKSGGWVPPSLRNRVGGAAGEGDVMQRRRDENSVRVSNLAEDVADDDLYELFGAFGSIQRVFIARDRETGAWG